MVVLRDVREHQRQYACYATTGRLAETVSTSVPFHADRKASGYRANELGFLKRKLETWMTQYEYRVVPAPVRGIKAKGARTPEDRFAHALAEVMNAFGADGWDYVRCDTLPSEERSGLTGRTTVYRNMLVFRRALVPVERSAEPQTMAAQPVSFAARVAATLRPGSVVAAAPPLALRAGTDTAPPAPPRLIGPADRGAIGDAPRVLASDTAADSPRPRTDDPTLG